jgi:CRP-like cAMP-binding protein
VAQPVLRDALKHADVFKGLTEDELSKVEKLCRTDQVAEGVLILEEDKKGGSVFLLLSGRVDIEIRPPFDAKAAQRIATIKPGELFGEITLVDGFLRSANARAVESCTIASIDDAKLRDLMERETAVGYKVMKNLARVLAGRVRDTNMRLRNTLSEMLYY